MSNENTEQDFELVDDGERKSSTSDSFENLDDKEKSSTNNSSADEGEEDETLQKTDSEEKNNETAHEDEEVEYKLPFVDQSIKDDAERPKEKDGEQLVEELLKVPLTRDQEQFYDAEASRRAITMLILFSAMMFTLPLLAMFTLYYWVFIDHYHLEPSQAMLYSGLCAAGIVIVICALFAYVAWKEEKDAEDTLKAAGKHQESESKKQK